MRADSSRGTAVPSSRSTFSSRSRIVCGAGPAPPTSIVPSTSRAPVSSSISLVATIWPSIACSGASPFSKRPEASVRRASLVEVRWRLGPCQLAASISTRVVVPRTSERSPPIRPAIEVGPSSSAISRTLGSSVRSTSSSVVIFSPSRARRTVSLPPATRSKSKACNGCPVSSIAKLVMSTTLLIGRWPAADRRAFSHAGDGPIVTSSNSRAVKRGQRSGSSTTTSAPGTSPGVPGSSAHGGGESGAPVIACTSRATP